MRNIPTVGQLQAAKETSLTTELRRGEQIWLFQAADDRDLDGWMALAFNGHGCEQALGDGEGEGTPVCCSHAVTKRSSGRMMGAN